MAQHMRIRNRIGGLLAHRPVLWFVIVPGAVVLTLYFLIVGQGTPEAFEKRKGRLANVKSALVASDDVSEITDIDLTGTTGLTVKARVRVPRTKAPPFAGVLIFGGWERGRTVVNFPGLEEFFDRGLLMSMDYPIERTTRLGFRDIPRVRRAAFDAVASILLMVDYLVTRPDVDPRRIVSVGVSFGSPFAVIAGGLDTRVKAVASLYGGGGLGPTFAHLIERERPFRNTFWGPAAAALLGRAGALLLEPLEPDRYVGMISPRPVLFINGKEDELVPARSAESLYLKAGEPRTMIWLKSTHIRGTEDQLLREMSLDAVRWLTAQGIL
jgi:fermentation-respiration switch protein FrsA (DUF1100 family)